MLFSLFFHLCSLAFPVAALRAERGNCDVKFSADPDIDVAGILSALQNATNSRIATYPTSSTQDHTADVYADWQSLSQVSAVHFIADMDIDCDGVDWNCTGNSDGYPLTSFGALDAREVPWFVLPGSLMNINDTFFQPNSLGAIICNGTMFYAIFGDTNGGDPEVIGEGSLLLGQTCFPNDAIDGNNGHEGRDVACKFSWVPERYVADLIQDIVFGGEVPDGVQNNTIDTILMTLKKLGDRQVFRFNRT
ncbi:fungal chitosanase of glycosyl hydrolase group 75-domain-containing protein [Mycena leptocephala]|nr:fungal chitosanase of glycosyl hydrolase group 75-domain-containing protein [Mycena leptocephala]